jgi:hypothetical protein
MDGDTEGKKESSSLLCLALFLLLYVFLPVFVLSCFLLLRAGGAAQAYWFSLVLLGVLSFYFRKKLMPRDVLIFFVLVVFSHVVSYYVFDFFHDGLAYHQPAVSRIAAGFNPVYDGYMNLGRDPDLWSDQATYFPKATEYFAAAVTAVWEDIQPGKAYGWILLFASICFALHCTRGEHILKRLLWVTACLNPVALMQIFGYVVDGALASLVVIALLYACFFYERKSLSRTIHVIGVVALSMLCCVKISGLAYASIIVFCICLFRFFESFRVSEAKGSARAFESAARATVLGLKLGGAMFLLTVIMGFVPYVTNPLAHRHIFYPLFQRENSVNDALKRIARNVYPTCNNRFTRLVFSTMAYPTSNSSIYQYPAELKNPLGAPWREWQLYETARITHAGGLGPLFFLLCILAIGYAMILRGRINVWLLLTLMAITAIQPHSWYVRFVPFVWLFPIVLFLSVPSKKEYLLSVPLLVFFINVSGVTYFSFSADLDTNQEIIGTLAPYKGQYVLLDKSIFQCDGFFDRFHIKQKFANPEATFLNNHSPWRTPLFERYTGRPAFGSNIAFEEDIPPIPDRPLVFADENAKFWLTMSEGVTFKAPGKDTILWAENFSGSTSEMGWNYRRKIKFYRKLKEKPTGDMDIVLTGSPRILDDGEVLKQKTTIYANNLQIGEWTWDRPGPSEKKVLLSRSILESSYNDAMRLLTLMFYIDPLESNASSSFNLRFEKMEFRPREGF